MAKIYVKKVPEEVDHTCRGCCFKYDDKNCKAVHAKYVELSCIYERKIFKIVRIEND